jgi:hypothetical protein
MFNHLQFVFEDRNEKTKTKMIKQLLILASISVLGQIVLAFDCHSQVPDYPDFDIERVKTTIFFQA